MDPQETKIYYAVVITCIVIGCIVFYFLISIIHQQRKNLLLQKKNLTAEITAMEKERCRIAADLHDEIAPYLCLTKIKFASLPDADEKAREAKTEAMCLLEESLKRMREIAFDLMPATLIRKGLVSALKEYTRVVNRSYPVAIALVADEEPGLPENKAIHVYRMMQEIIQNAIKHSGASELLVVFEQHEEMLVVKIAGNGKAFDFEALRATGTGMGLRNLQNRAELLGGKIFTKAAQKGGTSYIIEIPLDKL